MARYNPHHDAAPIFAAAAEWRDRCLLADGAILIPDEQVWTSANLAVLRTALVDRPDLGPDTFLVKLRGQLADSNDLVVQLAAELLWVMLLFPSNIGAENKRDTVQEVLSWRSTLTVPENRLLSDEVLGGLGSAGTAFNARRDRELGYLIDISSDLKGLELSLRRRVLSEPWAFSDFLSSG